MTSLKVLSYNIHKGFSVGNLRYVLMQIRDALHRDPVDVVFLQEVLGHHPAKHRRKELEEIASQFEYIAHEMWPHHVFGRNSIFDNGDHGNAILSRFPILAYENIDISTNPFEKRGVLHTLIDIPGVESPVHCLNVHLDLLHRGRIRQIQLLCDRINLSVPPHDTFVLAGDFNDWSGKITPVLHREVQAIEVFKTLTGKHVATFPSRFPLLKLDRIYVRGFNPQEARALTGSPWHDLSDHAPIVSHITLDSLEPWSSI